MSILCSFYVLLFIVILRLLLNVIFPDFTFVHIKIVAFLVLNVVIA